MEIENKTWFNRVIDILNNISLTDEQKKEILKMVETETIQITETEMFYIHDAVTKQYWLMKEKGEDPIVLKHLLSASGKVHEAFINKSKHKKETVIEVVSNETSQID